jgi:protein-L-isoaspartate(D-aspartate) O-methyltransferase
MARRLILTVAASMLLLLPARAQEREYEADRRRMVDTIVALAERSPASTGGDGIDLSILAAMREVPRHELVPEGVRAAAYENRPLPIGYGQTISQPYIVALMSDLANPDEGDVVLEIGTGSGYQAAVISRLVRRVYTIEIVEPLARQAEERVRGLGYHNITVRQGDGYHGWTEHAPFDAILVTAAASHIPPPLVAQLKPGGRMVIPVGPPFMAQSLMLVEKEPDGKVRTRALLPVSFVPLTGRGGR